MSEYPFPKHIIPLFRQDDFDFENEPLTVGDLSKLVRKNGDIITGSMTFLSNNNFTSNLNTFNNITVSSVNNISSNEISFLADCSGNIQSQFDTHTAKIIFYHYKMKQALINIYHLLDYCLEVL